MNEYEDTVWLQQAKELNADSQWAHAASWMLTARIAKSVATCNYDMRPYPTGFGSVLRLKLTESGRSAEILMNRAGSIRGTGFAGTERGWDDPSILTMPWVWFTCLAADGRRQVLEAIHRGLGIPQAKGRASTRQVVGFRLLGQILASRLSDTERWWTHNALIEDILYGDTDGSVMAGAPAVDGRVEEIVCIFRGDEPRAWVHDGWLWIGQERIDAFSRYRAGQSLASIAALLT